MYIIPIEKLVCYFNENKHYLGCFFQLTEAEWPIYESANVVTIGSDYRLSSVWRSLFEPMLVYC